MFVTTRFRQGDWNHLRDYLIIWVFLYFQSNSSPFLSSTKQCYGQVRKCGPKKQMIEGYVRTLTLAVNICNITRKYSFVWNDLHVYSLELIVPPLFVLRVSILLCQRRAKSHVLL
jgi:hypothetical protein